MLDALANLCHHLLVMRIGFRRQIVVGGHHAGHMAKRGDVRHGNGQQAAFFQLQNVLVLRLTHFRGTGFQFTRFLFSQTVILVRTGYGFRVRNVKKAIVGTDADGIGKPGRGQQAEHFRMAAHSYHGKAVGPPLVT